jgi:acyl-CoA thioesterase FadM
MVGLIHTPRTLFHIAKGLAKRRADGASSSLGGIGQENPYISEGRAGLFDTDYMMHMNNAAYLSHAEYARWELCAYNGMLSSMYHDNVNFVVGGTAIRFRREVAPIFRKFQVHSFLARLDERHLWIYHAFRYPPGGKDPGRIRAHAICQGIAIQGRNVLDPRVYLKDIVGIDSDVVDSLMSVDTNVVNDATEQDIFAAMMDKYSEMEAVFKTATAMDDEKLANKS